MHPPLFLRRLRTTVVLCSLLAIASLVGLVFGYGTATTTPSRVYWDTAYSTTSIVVELSDSTSYGGTGFYVSPHVLLTCAHVLQGKRTCLVYPCFEDSGMVGRVLYADSTRDIAIVYTDSASSAPPLTFGEAELGDPVFTIGNPKGYLASFSTGIVSQKRDDPDNDRSLVQCTSTVGPGSSGGPILNADGQVVAMTSHVDGDASNYYAFGVSSETLRLTVATLWATMDSNAKHSSMVGVDTTGWASAPRCAAELDALLGFGSDFEMWISDQVSFLVAFAPIAALFAALAFVVFNRYRRVRRHELRVRMRMQLETLRGFAYLPDDVIEAECRRV